nr:MAG TPA: hypothetical protein [Caudoviricetes sp.]
MKLLYQINYCIFSYLKHPSESSLLLPTRFFK